MAARTQWMSSLSVDMALDGFSERSHPERSAWLSHVPTSSAICCMCASR